MCIVIVSIVCSIAYKHTVLYTMKFNRFYSENKFVKQNANHQNDLAMYFTDYLSTDI